MPTSSVKLGHLLGHVIGPGLDARDHPGYRWYVPGAHLVGQALRRICDPSHPCVPLAPRAGRKVPRRPP